MTQKQSRQLHGQACKLFTLGLKVEHFRKKLKGLVEKGVAYHSKEMIEALEAFQKADAEWKGLEQEYLQNKNSVLQLAKAQKPA